MRLALLTAQQLDDLVGKTIYSLQSRANNVIQIRDGLESWPPFVDQDQTVQKNPMLKRSDNNQRIS